MARSSSNIDVALRLRGARKFAKEVDQAGRDLEKMGFRGAGAMAKFANQSQKLKDFGKSWTKNVTLPIVAGVGLSIKAASDWESAFANVRKTVDTNELGFARLERGLRDMAMEIPVAAGDLAELAGAAGQLGIEEKNILGFTRTIADLGVATDLVGEAGAITMARFANNMGMPQTEFDRLGSTVVALGNTLPATESEIMNFASRISAASRRIGLAEHETVSWAGALAGLDIRAEAGGTAMSTVFSKMGSAVIAGGKDLREFSKVSGLSGKEFAKLFRKDASAATLKFIEGLDRIHKGGGDMVGTLKDMGLGGLRITDTLGRAAANTDLLTEALGTGAKGWEENSALTEEAEQRYKTFEGQMQILKNVITEIGIAFAENLLPHLSEFVQGVVPKLQGMMKFFKGLPGPVQKGALAFLGLLAAIGPISWGLGLVAGAVGKWLIVMRKLYPVIKGAVFITRVWTVALLTNPIGLIVLGLVALIAGLVLAYKKVDWFRDAVDAAFAWVKQAATDAADWIVGAAEWIGRAFTNVKDWVTNAVGNVVNFVKKHWSKIVILFGGPMGAAVVLVIKNFSKIKNAATDVKDWVTNAFRNVVGFIREVPGKIDRAATGMFDGIKDALREVLRWVDEKLKGLGDKLGPLKKLGPLGGSLPGIGPLITLGQGLGGIPGLAGGGTTLTGGSVVVGERGPELLDLPPAARVTPLKGTGGLRDSVSGLIEIVLHSNLYVDGERMAGNTARHVADAAARR